MKLKDFIKSISTDDNGKPLDQDMEVLFHSACQHDMILLSVYEDNGIINIDVGG